MPCNVDRFATNLTPGNATRNNKTCPPVGKTNLTGINKSVRNQIGTLAFRVSGKNVSGKYVSVKYVSGV
jgi:hypothetical protein